MSSREDWTRAGFKLQGGALIRPPSNLIKKPAMLPLIGSTKNVLGHPSNAGALVLPLPPSVNRLYGFNKKTGRRFMYREGKEFCEAVRRIVQPMKLVPLEGPIVLHTWIYRKNKLSDLANFSKALDDILQGVLYLNDRQIVEHHAYLRDDPLNPRAEVLVNPQ